MSSYLNQDRSINHLSEYRLSLLQVVIGSITFMVGSKVFIFSQKQLNIIDSTMFYFNINHKTLQPLVF